jgi:hypothetical protein
MKRKPNTILALLAVIITVGFLWYTNQSVLPKEASWDDVLAETEAGGYRLINTDELWKRYQSKPDTLLLVDTRQEWEYRSGHIKGSLHRVLLSGSGMSPQRLGGPGGRKAWLHESLPGSSGLSGTERQKSSGG